MSISENQASIAARDVDPLLKDLNDKKQSFRRNVVSLASELKELRSRLASKEQSYVKETLTRQVQDFYVFLNYSVSFCLSIQTNLIFLCFSYFGRAKKIITLMSIISTFGVFVCCVGSRKIQYFI